MDDPVNTVRSNVFERIIPLMRTTYYAPLVVMVCIIFGLNAVPLYAVNETVLVQETVITSGIIFI